MTAGRPAAMLRLRQNDLDGRMMKKHNTDAREVLLADLCYPDQIGQYGIPAAGEPYTKDKNRYLRITDISDDGLLLDADKKGVSGAIDERYFLSEGDVVFARTGNSTGRSYLYDKNDGRLVYAGFLIKYKLDPTKVNPRYIHYFTQSAYYKAWVKNLSVGSTRGNISATTFAECPIYLPDRIRQDCLVDVLSTIDRKIALNRKRIATLEAMAKEIYDYWFVQFDFPDAHGRPYKSSGGAMVYNPDLKREIPKGWKVRLLGELMKTNAFSYNERTLPSRIWYIDIAAVSNGVVSSKTEYDRDHAPGRARRIAKRGDTIWSSVRPNLRAYALVLNPQEDDVFSTGFTVLSPVDVPYGFLYLTVTTEAYVSYLVSRTGNSAYPAVLPSAFGEYEIAVPPKDLLDRFADQTERMFDLRQNCFDEIQSQTALRDFLLPLLMNGQVKVL